MNSKLTVFRNTTVTFGLLFALACAISCDKKTAEEHAPKTANPLSLSTVSNIIQRGMSFQVLTQRLGTPIGLITPAKGEKSMSFGFNEVSYSPDKSQAAIGVYVGVVDEKVDDFMVIWKPVSPSERTDLKAEQTANKFAR